MKRWTENPWRRFGLPARVGWLVVGGYGVAAVLVVASEVSGWYGAYGTRPVDEIVSVPCLVFAAACAGYAARFAVGRRRLGWLALSDGSLGLGGGEVIWGVYELRLERGQANHPAAAEVVFVLYPVGAMASLVLLSNLSRHTPRRLVLDGLIVAASLCVVSSAFLEKQLGGNSSLRPATVIEIFADVVLITTAILMLVPSSSWRPAEPQSVGRRNHDDRGCRHRDGVSDRGRRLSSQRTVRLGPSGRNGIDRAGRPVQRHRVTHSGVGGRICVPRPALVAVPAAPGRRRRRVARHDSPDAARSDARPVGILVVAVLVRQLVVLVENQSLLSEVSREAFRDSLTGLPNRANFLHRLDEAVARRRHDTAPDCAVVPRPG